MFFEGPETDQLMPVARRKDSGAWEVRVTPPGGQLIRRSSSKWTKADALDIERRLILPERTLEDGLDKWHREYARFLKQPKKHDSMVELMRPILRGRTFDEVQDVAALIRRQCAELAPATINRRLSLLRRIANLAYKEWNWVETPVGKKIRLLREENERHYYLRRSDIERLRAACTIPEAGNHIVFAAFTGLRLSEQLGVHRNMVIDGDLHVRAGKNGRPRILPLHPRALHIARQLPYSNVTQAILRKQWVAAREHCALEHIRWHDLRHTFASWAIQAGAPLHVLKDLLGHKSIHMTMRYAHLATSNLRDAVMKI